MKSLGLFVVLSFGLAASLSFGCASSTPEEDPAADESQMVAENSAITLKNFVTHPKIKAIRAEVATIDSLSLTETKNPGCDGSASKFTLGAGGIRKIVETGGEGGFEGETTAYYDESGKLRFLFDLEQDFQANKATESRVYFGADNNVLWQVVRQTTAEGREGRPDFGKAADRLPTPEEKFQITREDDPEAWFGATGCSDR
jgi:hypothetical protein